MAGENKVRAERDAIAEPWGSRTPYGAGEPWPVRVDMRLDEGVSPDDVDVWVQTASVLHSNGDAMDIAVAGGRMVGVRGRATDRINHGRLDVKDLFGWQANASADRLTSPLVRENGELVETDWDTALDRIATVSRDLMASDGPAALAFYTSGQLFLEEYYTLAAIARGGIGTPHLDGNTRLCTATAAQALKESFGCDGQPGSYTDFDHADVIAAYGHNIAETQSVLWERILDRRRGADPPVLVCVDPRPTVVAREADIHLAPVPGTNMALMNGLLHEIVANGWVDEDWIERNTVGYPDLVDMVSHYPPERVADITGVTAAQLREAARVLGTAERLVSTVLQGFYQSHQATAAAVAVDNVHLVRGMIGRPGCGVFQMNGQPTAQNTRECGADGDMPGFRNWANERHMAELAELWNVDLADIPHSGPPTPAMDIFAGVEDGSIRQLWVSGTNPAVSLPELGRIRALLGSDELHLVVQDLYFTETAELADVVLPAAAWGEKIGTFTNADRTVHLSDKAVDPPGQARSDLDIFLAYARKMQLADRDGAQFPQWHDAPSAFAAWQRAGAGRPCDYTGLSYEKLRGGSGIPWPCNADHPDGLERLYADGFPAHPDECEQYGKNLVTGEPWSEDEYRRWNPNGLAMIKTAPYVPPVEPPDDVYPFHLITGRTLTQFHTRTKTGRVWQLTDAAPEVWVEVNVSDAVDLDLAEGDLVRVETRRGEVLARVRPTEIRRGVLFLPFHYGYWDAAPDDRQRAANELTPTSWDPVSKQPLFKTGAASLAIVAQAEGATAPAPTHTASAPAGTVSVARTAGGGRAVVVENPAGRRAEPGWR
ncbi:molybdopterin-dependent oxidoreductase [Thermocrispum sp.]|uniref:molybdopterin oxidoreductase family protein n=1 Tax=Thermocrispum sp. TaxID=2060768 RepID=UPI00257C9237|nr:molybdopterin-dependent oxidoreductase [Thermocrispum sp.]